MGASGNFNPRSPHGERLKRPVIVSLQAISTHAPRTGSDAETLKAEYNPIEFQPTLPARGATRIARQLFPFLQIFQPTLPARGATYLIWKQLFPNSNFNPRSPHGERRGEQYATTSYVDISTHAPRTGSDATRPPPIISPSISTHAPRTGSDHDNFLRMAGDVISTHAPRTGSDISQVAQLVNAFYFNPRSPHGERLRNNLAYTLKFHFNPRSPHGERHLQMP